MFEAAILKPQRCRLYSGTLVALTVCLLAAEPGLAQFSAAEPPYQTGFPLVFPDAGRVFSSPVAVGDLNGDGKLDLVVGTGDGVVEAYTHNGVRLWSFDTGEAAIEGKAAIGDVDGDSYNEVVIGSGSTRTQPASGVLHVLSHTGVSQCSFTPLDILPVGEGVFSSPALADLDGNDGGKLEIVFGAWDFRVRALHHDCTTYWENFTTDSVWSSPAVGDLDRDGKLEVVIGSATSEQPFYGTLEGGQVHAYRFDGESELPGFPIQLDETVDSSPALGDLDGDGYLDIVVGTGLCWENPACAPPPNGVHEVTEAVYAFNWHGQSLPGWPFALPEIEYAFASPALADLDEDGALEVVISTAREDFPTPGRVYAIDGNGIVLSGWPTQAIIPASPSSNIPGQTNGSPVVADINGDGHQEIMMAAVWEVVVWDRNGNQLSRDDFPVPSGDYVLVTNYSLASTPTVADIDGDGDLELITASANANPPTAGALYVWDFSGSPSPRALPWPSFKRGQRSLAAVPNLFADDFESGVTSAWE